MVTIDYTPTAEMMADGLTKSLPKETFRAFRKQLNMVDKKELLEANRRRELADDEQQLERILSKEDLWDQFIHVSEGTSKLSQG